MADSPPQLASTEAFNQLLRLGGEDVPALRQTSFRLQGLFRRSPSDMVAALALLHVHIKLGERQQADLLAEELWGRRGSMAIEERIAFAPALSWIGQVDRAVVLTEDRMFQSTPAAVEVRHVAAAHAFLSRWEPEWLRATVRIDPGWLAQVQACGLLQHIRARQSLVNEMVVPMQCGERILFCPDGEDSLNLMRMVYVPLDYRGRRELAGQISAALDAFYREVTVEPHIAASLLSEVILPVAAMPAQTEFEVNLAA